MYVFLPIFISVLKNGDLFYRKSGCLFDHFCHCYKKMDIYSLYEGENQKPYIYFLYKIQRYLLALKERTFISFKKISDFFLALKKRTFNFADIYFV